MRTFFSNLFATRRELKRLAADVKYYRGRALALEKKLEATNAERSERELLLVDRIVVSKGRFAVGDEAKHNVMLKDTETLEKKEAEELQYFLEKRKQELIEDARDAGEPISAAEQLYQFNEQSYIEEFQRASKFE